MIPAYIDKQSLRRNLWFRLKSQIPHRPGVYIFKDETGKILYVGKAINLYHRVSSYFSGKPDSSKTAALVKNIKSLETIEVLSELEALILEANLIKKYLPPYNIRLTDDKDYLYIKITAEDFPKVLTARKKELSDAKEYFGPFPSASTVRTTLKKLRRIFPWCNNKGQVVSIKYQWLGIKKHKPCFYYHLGLCPGSCAGKIDKKEYHKIISRLSKFMQGEKEQVLEDLQDEMMEASKNLEFEKAQSIKKTITGLQYLTQSNNAQIYLENPNFVEDQNKQALEILKKGLKLSSLPERIECYDISNILGKFAVGSLVVLSNGDIDKKWYRKFKIIMDKKPNDVGMMREVLKRRIKHNEWPKPDLILVDGGRGQAKAAKLEVGSGKWEVPIFGLAKRMEWLYPPEGEIIKLPKSSKSLQLLRKIRNEAHRFAISYHKKLRDRSLLYNRSGV